MNIVEEPDPPGIAFLDRPPEPAREFPGLGLEDVEEMVALRRAPGEQALHVLLCLANRRVRAQPAVLDDVLGVLASPLLQKAGNPPRTGRRWILPVTPGR